VNKNLILSSSLLLAATIYVFITIQSNNYVLLDLVYAIGFCCLSILSASGTAFIMLKPSDRRTISGGVWVDLFSRSQVLSNFIPGVGVLYRANVLRRDFGVSVASSSAAFLRALALTAICCALMVASMYWGHLVGYISITILFIGFLAAGVVIILIPTWKLIPQIRDVLSKNKLNERSDILNKQLFSIGNLFLFICLFMVSAITISAAYYFLVRGAQHSQISVFDSTNIFVAMKALSFAPSFIPANFGLQEFMLIGMNQLANIGINDVVVFSLMIRIINLISNLVIIVMCRCVSMFFSDQQTPVS
jgi:hypothetical protein